MRKGAEPEVNLSFAQQKLGALLTRTKELLSFADDDECENTFALLADFAQGTLEHKDERRTSRFDGMKLEELLKLRKETQTAGNVSNGQAVKEARKTQKNEEDDEDDEDVPMTMQKEKLKNKQKTKDDEGDEEADDDEDFMPKAKAKASKQPQKRKAVESNTTQPPRKRDAHDAVPDWNIEAFPLVGKLTSITVEPSVRIDFISKPGGQGNLAFSNFYADEEKLLELDAVKDAKIKKKAVSKLENALEAYFADKSVPQALVAVLEQCRWARGFVARRAITLRESAESVEKVGE